MAFISRNPFAREELHRQHIPARQLAYGMTCDNCGQRNAYGGLFQYRTEGDANPRRPGAHKGLFCSEACHDSYHG